MELQLRTVRMRLANENDAPFILSLRLDSGLNRHLSPVEDDLSKQIDWLRAYKRREELGLEYYFIVESLSGTPFGTVRLYNFDGDCFTWGSWVLRKDTPPFVAIESAVGVYDLAFRNLGFDRSRFDVRTDNDKVVAFHKRFGAQVVAQDEQNIYFEFLRSEYESARERYARFINT